MTGQKQSESPASGLVHGYGFDPSHGYGLDALLQQTAPEEPADYVPFWKARYAAALGVKPRAVLRDTGEDRDGWRIHEWSYHSTGGMEIKGWVLLPVTGVVKRGFLIGHGYSGRSAPDLDWDFKESALFFPCFRGLGRSSNSSISSEIQWHILHDIQSRRRYVLGGCVEDVWVGTSAILRLFPELAGHLGYLGISFSGGIGAMAIPWEERIQRMHLNVPTFGNHPLRLKLPSTGSAASVQGFVRKYPKVMDVLEYYDAAVAARHIRIPVHCACALFDPAVPPAGQFAIYNALAGEKHLFLLSAGHHEYPAQADESNELRQEINNFFADM